MKLSLFLGLAAALAPAGARLYHVPIGKLDTASKGTHRMLDAENFDQDNLYQARGVQYVDLKVGCPPQSQSAIISTASSAIGFPCSDCTNDCGEGSHLNGLYHQELSTCFTKVGCDNCTLPSYSSSCSAAGKCPVQMSYVEGSSWTGVEVQDTVSIGGEDADEDAFPLRFGCQSDITGLFENQIPDGIFGMNKHPGSAIRQWSELGYLDASAFSLCYNVREDVKKKSGVMVLGGSDTRLHDQPMVFAKDVGVGSAYEVRIKDVQLKRGPALMMSTSSNEATASLGLSGTDTAVLDSGTTCTYLDRSWRNSLASAWDQMTDGKYDLFSYLSITADELEELPTLVFELEGETTNETITVEYPPIRYMEKHHGGGYGFCMFTDTGSAILGNTFMSGHDVLHDLGNKRIGFAESQCETHVLEEEPADEDTYNPVLKTPIILQVLPIHVRNQKLTNPESPWTGVLYGMLASGLVAFFALLAFYCYGRCSSTNEVVSPSKASFWATPNIKHAYLLSWISLFVTFFAIVAGISLYVSTGSSLFLVLGLENVVDFLSSAAVLWRFFAPSNNITKELEAKLQAREQRASVAISFVLVILGVATLVTAVSDASRGQEEPEQQTAALAISLVSFFLFGALTVVKFRYAKVFQSPSLYKDGICSAVGTVLSASLFLNTLIIVQAPGAWWIDPVVAILCGFGALVYGIWTLYTACRTEGLPIFSVRWWFLSHGTQGEAAAAEEEKGMESAEPKPFTGEHA
eukprot:CAMPEP_0194202438 /NCGR_PEP_ID=MMETSP0156-20130528/2450_1 /TAXON_ID=33649 /ORGANISM="Thalassionema nitzschioides, Strain L26-B" /LENGTH=746 /DNA_ID=CAMNT_0038927927 /DNA_START=339 /DNA_END=2579 /DNA_ORIENTATION=-